MFEELRAESSCRAYADMTDAQLMAWDAFYSTRSGQFVRMSEPWRRMQTQREVIASVMKARDGGR